MEAQLVNSESPSEPFETAAAVSAGPQSASAQHQPWPMTAWLLVQIRVYCAIAAIGGAAVFCWAWSGFSVPALAANYRWNELIFSAIAVLVLRRRAFPLAIGTAIFATLWIGAAFLWMGKILP